MNAEKYNRLHMPVLAVLVMDAVRELSKEGAPLTHWSVSVRVMSLEDVAADVRRQTYARIGSTLRHLKSAGMLSTEVRWDAEHKRMHNFITLLR